jgi:hypothetical protein
METVISKSDTYTTDVSDLINRANNIQEIKFNLSVQKAELTDQLCRELCACLSTHSIDKYKPNEFTVTLDLTNDEKGLAVLSRYYLTQLITYKQINSTVKNQIRIIVTIK